MLISQSKESFRAFCTITQNIHFWAPMSTGLQSKPHEPCTNTTPFSGASRATREHWCAVHEESSFENLLSSLSAPSLYCHMGLFYSRTLPLFDFKRIPLAHFRQPARCLWRAGQPSNLPTAPPAWCYPGRFRLPLLSSNTPFCTFQKKNSPISTLFCIFLKPEWYYAREIITKWNKKVCVMETDCCENALMKLRRRHRKGTLSACFCFKSIQIVQDSYLPLRYIIFYCFSFLETKYNF